MLNPIAMPVIAARVEPRTEAEPLMLQIQGMFSLENSPRKRMPEGNGIPMKKPSGKINNTVSPILNVDSNGRKYSRICGRAKTYRKVNTIMDRHATEIFLE